VSEPPKIDEQELDSIRDLLKDFAFSPSITPEFVYREAWKRYTVLSNQLPYLQNYLGVLNHEWPKTLHYFIYRSLFRFAGSYRSTLDPGNGRVGFGGVKAQKHTHTFEGYHPDKIESEVVAAFEHLSGGNSDDCVDRVIRFYQKFVRIHPFYDANGRIARIITNIYLLQFDKQVAWIEFDSKGKFLRKLNQCHK
jgi:fido (protein-threonine AMPylation protein)